MSRLSPEAQPTTIPVTEEEVEVSRRVVDSGGALRLRKQVEERPVQAREPVVHEYVDVERVPLGHVVPEAPGIRREGDLTVIPVIEERLVTRKELVLVEEIRLTRRREVREVSAELTLRRESVAIERFDPESQRWLPESES
jgi:stress response protein YsnF